MGLCLDAKGYILQLAFLVGLGLFGGVFYHAIYQSRWIAVVDDQFAEREVDHFFKDFLATRFLYFCDRDDHNDYHSGTLYHHFWTFVLWLGLSSDYFYGICLSKNRVADRWQSYATKETA
jgi:hypothetical protein